MLVGSPDGCKKCVSLFVAGESKGDGEGRSFSDGESASAGVIDFHVEKI